MQAEIQCLNCARVLAEFRGELNERVVPERLTCRTGLPCLERNARGRVVCSYCGGKPIVTDLETMGYRTAS